MEAKNNVRGRFGQRCRGFRKLLIAKPKAIDDDLQVLSLNEAQALELVKKRHVPAFPSSAWPAIWSSRVRSLARPGGNVTGVSLRFEIDGKRVHRWRDLFRAYRL